MKMLDLFKSVAKSIAYSRGRCARISGESRHENPYRDKDIWYEIWALGWESAVERRKKEDFS